MIRKDTTPDMTGNAMPRRVGGMLPPTAGTTAPVGRPPTGAPGQRNTAAVVFGAAATAGGRMRAGHIIALVISSARAKNGRSTTAANVSGAAATAMGLMLDSGYTTRITR